jgi:cyclomaltodextrinase
MPKEKGKSGRNPKLNPKTHCIMVHFDDSEWNDFLSMFEESGVYARSVFLKAHFFGQKFKVLKVDKTMLDYYTKLSDFHAQFRCIGTNYNQIVNDEMLHSCTNYECYKGIYSSFNSMNMFEIAHSLNRQYGPEQWCIYRGKHLMSFVDNHDVTRIASILTNKNHLPLTYGLLLGVPCIYYGSEWGEEGVKAPNNDYALRPCFEEPKPNELTEEIKKMIHVRTGSNALCHGSYRNVVLTNHQLIFERRTDDERMLVAINASDAPFTAHNGELGGTMTDLLTGNEIQMSGQLEMPPYSVQYLK